MKMYCNQNIKALIDYEAKPANYCCDEAWYSNAYPDEYKKLVDENDEYKYALIACKAVEDSAEYGTAEGPLQHEMYDMLFNYAGLTIKERDLLNSKDRMTNFYYVMKMAVAFLNPEAFNKTNETILPYTSFSGIGPNDDTRRRKYREAQCFTHLFCAYIEALDGASASDIISSPVVENIKKQMEDYAEKSSWIGNYTCIPEEINGERNLNTRKGNVGHALALSDKTIVNDQFALFTEWVDENTTDDEQGMIDDWKKAMLLDGEVWKIYREASEKYKSIWTEEPKDPKEVQEHRLAAFADYLELVNSAIKFRSEQIARTLKSTD